MRWAAPASTARTRKTTPSRTSATRPTPPHARVLLRAGQRQQSPPPRRRLRAAEDRRRLVRQLRALRRNHRRQAPGGAALRAPLHRVPARDRGGGADGGRVSRAHPLAVAARPMPLIPARVSLGSLVTVGHRALRLLRLERAPASGENDPQAAEAMRRAEAARAAGRPDEARTLFRYVVQRWPAHVGGLHALRDLAVEARDWDE